MKFWPRLLVVLASALAGMVLGVVAEWLAIVTLVTLARAQEVEGTGLVIVGLAPFAALTGAGVGVWLALRKTRSAES